MKGSIYLGLLFILFQMGSSQLCAQGDRRNLEKYWLYRQRMAELFVKVGPALGESVPAAEIDQFRVVNGHGGRTWRQSDGTITLGWYIAVLATEHELLKRYGYATDENVEELFYALNALWRLDAHSNYYDYGVDNWPACTTLAVGAPAVPMTSENFDDDNLLDGYVIRSDAPDGFHRNFPGLDNTTSETLSPWGQNCRAKEMSQDQAIFLLMGLVAVKKWVDPAVEFNGVPLRGFAVNEALRIVRMLWSPPHYDWKLRNPLNDSVVPIGASGVGWGYPKAKMGEAFNEMPGSFGEDNPSPFWLAQGVPITFGNEMTLGMAGAMAAIGNAWGDQTAANLNRYALPSTRAEKGRDREIYYALHHLLHGSPLKDSYVSANIYQGLLDLAPCDGPHSTWPHPAPFYGWTTDSRFTGMVWGNADLDQDGDKEAYNQFIAGQQGTAVLNAAGDMYVGLDYMLLFNLYFLMYDGTAYDPDTEWEDLKHANLNQDCSDQIGSLLLYAYPNPSDGLLNLWLRVPYPTGLKITLASSSGAYLSTLATATDKFSGEFVQEFDLRDLQPGIYILQVQTELSKTFMKVVILK